MKKRTLLSALAALTIALIVAVPTRGAEGQASSPKEGGAWGEKMQSLYRTLADLLTDVTSDKRFRDPANQRRIEKEAKQLAVLAHDLSQKGSMSPDADPAVSMIAGLFAGETQRAVTEWRRGNRPYARSILRTIPGYCITCHTRNASGPQFAELAFEPTSKALTPLELGEFYAATRQFDRAQKEFIQVIRDPRAAAAYGPAWEEAVQQGLTIAVRVKQDPEQAQEIVQSVLDMQHAPSFAREDAKSWKVSLDQWQKEPGRQALSEEGLYAEALRLMGEARETQRFPIDRTADVLYLRASAALHDLMQKAPQGEHAGEALLLTGISYEVLNPLKTEDLHDLYYEACIRKVPHTATADLCYRKYEQSVFFDYTGSAGTDIPEDARAKLLELRALAQPGAPLKP